MAIVIVLLTWNLFSHRQSFAHTTLIACIAASAYFYEFRKTANLRYVVFKNTHIEYNVGNISETKIKLSDITSLNKTFSIKYKRHGGIVFNKFALAFIFFCFTAVILNAILFGKVKEMFFIFIALFLSLFIPKILLWLYNGERLLNYRFFDAIVVKDNNNFINILPTNLMDRQEIRTYFLKKLGKDINKMQNILFIL